MGKKCPRLEVNIAPTWLLAKTVVVSPSLPQHLALIEQYVAVLLVSLTPDYLYTISIDALITKNETQNPQTTMLSFS